MKDQLLFNNLEIRNYRAFDHLIIKKLGHVNLFIGKNNIGKSSLLEALWLYANLGAPFIIQQILSDRDDISSRQLINQKSPFAVSQGVWNLFYGYPPIERIDQSIEIGGINAPDSSLKISMEAFETSKLLGGDGQLSAVAEGRSGYSGYPGETVPVLVIRIGAFRKVLRLDESLEEHSKRWLLQPREVLDLSLPCPFIGPNGVRQSDLMELWKNIALSELKNDIIESLCIINPAIEDIAVFNIGDSVQGVSGYSGYGGQNVSGAVISPAVRVKVKGQMHPMPLKSLGDGMNRLFGLALALVNAQNGILLVDEIENGLHYSVLPSVWNFILKVSRQLNVQVFATTHSTDCLKAFHLASKADPSSNGIATRIEYKKGEFVTRQFDETRLEEILREDIEIR